MIRVLGKDVSLFVNVQVLKTKFRLKTTLTLTPNGIYITFACVQNWIKCKFYGLIALGLK